MSFRISTAGQHSYGIAEILKQQVKLSRTQQQLASGERISTPADDPVGATRLLGLERTQSQLAQYGKNAGMVEDRLSLGEQSLADLNALLQRVHGLTVGASNGALDNTSLRSLAAELRTRAQELQDIGNRQDSNGEFLFAGFSTSTRPFSDAGLGVTYAGDQGVRALQVSSSQSIADGIPGQRVFMDVAEGNGHFMVEHGTNSLTPGANLGTGSIGSGQVVNGAVWAAAGGGEFTIRFSDNSAPADGVAETWSLLDAGGNPVLDGGGAPIQGTYVDGAAISVLGVQFTLTGQPAAGDGFTVRPAGNESLFKTLNDLAAALEAGAQTPQQQAVLNTSLNHALTQLDQGMNHVTDLRTEIGARLSALDTAASLRDDLDLQVSGSIAELRDIDYAEAISRLNQQLAGLQAAQAAYTKIGQMSLFDWLR
jgi:flagellar hook-associated protein 3 FlgL